MRIGFLIGAVAVATLFDLCAAQAYYGSGPWCAVQSLGAGTVTQNCTMLNFEQCRMETIAGNRGFCIPNPYWPGAYGLGDAPRRTHKRRVRHR
ncbi:MAG TPA: hypothetical protein VKB15_09765 [Xanthobacteraceae bacterium]|nr:hypothetical protein [Xanthobacteraceae bacterium]